MHRMTILYERPDDLAAFRRYYEDTHVPLARHMPGLTGWNLCWLVLEKVKSDSLIPYYAGYQAALPAMWGNRMPSTQQVEQLALAFAAVRHVCDGVTKCRANEMTGMVMGDRTDAVALG